MRPKKKYKTQRCQFGTNSRFLGGGGKCGGRPSKKSDAPKSKKNTFGRGVKSGNSLMSGWVRNLTDRKNRKKNNPNPNQPHANPRFL